jgi:hypothetical protein
VPTGPPTAVSQMLEITGKTAGTLSPRQVLPLGRPTAGLVWVGQINVFSQRCLTKHRTISVVLQRHARPSLSCFSVYGITHRFCSSLISIRCFRPTEVERTQVQLLEQDSDSDPPILQNSKHALETFLFVSNRTERGSTMSQESSVAQVW